jgi:uncharacterized membrane protein YeaQ/YmgE (transglycosylase-associated protein family)
MLVTSIIAWIFLGFIVGIVASKIAKGSGQWLLMEMTLGVLGAFVGGVMYHLVGQTGLTVVSLRSVLASLLGAAAVLVVYHGVAGRRARA